jgi:hypothetical protein
MLIPLTFKENIAQRGFTPIMPLLIIAIIMGGLILAVSMVREPQIFSPKAAESDPSHEGLQTAPAEVPFFGVSVGESNITTPASDHHELPLADQTHNPVNSMTTRAHTPPTHNPASTTTHTANPHQEQCISQLTCHYHPGWCQDQLNQGKTMCQDNNHTTAAAQQNINHPNTPFHSLYHGYCHAVGVMGVHCNN